MVVLDATMLLFLLDPSAGVPFDTAGKPIAKAKERVQQLIATLDKEGTRVLIPTPALSEVLVRAGADASGRIVSLLTSQSPFRVEPFDTRAAIEVSAMLRKEFAPGKKQAKGNATWAKIKFDRQIVAIAQVNGATHIYSTDADIRALGRRAGIEVVGLADLPEPDEKTPNYDLFEQPG